jgi:hypothetical protein
MRPSRTSYIFEFIQATAFHYSIMDIILACVITAGGIVSIFRL